MSLFTAAELEELRRADAKIDAEFVQTAEEIAESRARDREAQLAAMDNKKRRNAEYGRAYREENRDAIQAKRQKKYAANREKMQERSRDYYWANRDKEAVRSKLYYEANRAKELARCKAYREAHREEIAARRKKRKEQKENDA